MIFLDTNIFLYVSGPAHPHRRACAALLQRIAKNDLEATTSSEVLQEILYVLDPRARRRDAITLTQHLLLLFPNLLPVSGRDAARACELLQRYPRISVRDAIHAATMLQNGVKRLVSVDPDFDQISEIRRLSPEEV